MMGSIAGVVSLAALIPWRTLQPLSSWFVLLLFSLCIVALWLKDGISAWIERERSNMRNAMHCERSNREMAETNLRLRIDVLAENLDRLKPAPSSTNALLPPSPQSGNACVASEPQP
jgi:hypothetical protein